MKQIGFIIIICLTYSIGYCQNFADTLGYPLKTVYKVCKYSPFDTVHMYKHYYNNYYQKVKYEDYTKGRLTEYLEFYYDLNQNFIGKQRSIVIYFNDLNCNKKDRQSCEQEWIEVYGRKVSRNYDFDSINKILYVHFDIDKDNKLDTIFENSRLRYIKKDKDTLAIYEYDKKNRLSVKIDKSTYPIICSKYKYKKDIVYEYQYVKNRKKPSYILKYTYNDKNRIIEIHKTYIFDSKLQPDNNFDLSKYYYDKENKLILFDFSSDAIDPCMAECCKKYKEIFEYYDNR
jgi:hypothetical protein